MIQHKQPVHLGHIQCHMFPMRSQFPLASPESHQAESVLPHSINILLTKFSYLIFAYKNCTSSCTFTLVAVEVRS